MTPRSRSSIRAAVLLVAGILSIFFTLHATPPALGQDMARSGTVSIKNETERSLFWSLICMCGCPRETLGTCSCDYAHSLRDELRAGLESGKSVEQIKTEYAARFGPQALAVPPNKGSQRFVWLLPLAAIVFGAAFVVVTLRKWRRRAEEEDAKAAKKDDDDDDADASDKAPSRDAYDDKLDEELARMSDDDEPPSDPKKSGD